MEPQRVHVQIEEITAKGGGKIKLDPNSILVVTGPNNVGKSTFLSEIALLYRDYGRRSYAGKVIDSIKKVYIGKSEDVIPFLVSKIENKQEDENSLRITYRNTYKIKNIISSWEDGNLPYPVEQLFAKYFDLNDRLSSRQQRDDDVEKAADKMFYDEDRELQISSIFRKSFGSDLILQRDRQRVFRIGSRKDVPKHKDRLTRGYKEKLENMQMVSAQGSGMRGFSRLTISLMNSWESLLIVDEPELFLHPPQMRHLAKMLCQSIDRDRQIVLATHDENFLRHLLDFGKDRVTVLRIDRKKNKNDLSLLDSNLIRDMWNDPLLRTSNMMGALFHDAAVLCEGETDVRFLKTLMEDVYNRESLPDVEFYSCNGKSKIRSIAESLKSIRLPVFCCLDFDIFQNPEELFRLYKTMGGKDETVRTDALELAQSVESAKFVPKAKTVIDKLIENIENLDRESPITTSNIAILKNIIDHGSPWANAKSMGIRSFTDPKYYNSAKGVVEKCEAVGIFINIEGELEAFCRAISSSRKSDWLSEVLQKDLVEDPDLRPARDYVERLYGRIATLRA